MASSKVKLTKKKQKWAQSRKDVTLKGSALYYNASLQEKYNRKIQRLVTQMTSQVTKEIIKFFNGEIADSFFESQDEMMALDAGERSHNYQTLKAKKEYDKRQNPQKYVKKDVKSDKNIGSQARILMNKLETTFTKLFNDNAKDLAESMMSDTEKTSKANLHSSLKQLTGGLSLNTGVVPKGMEQIVPALVAENVSYIKSIPQEYFKNVTGAVMRSITNGEGLASLVPDIEKTIKNADRSVNKIPRKKNDGKLDDYNRQVKRRANNIALDQTRKAYSSINKQKLMNAGVKKFEWIHSFGGAHPRASHIKIDGKIFSFENVTKEQAALGVPEDDRGLPGVPINCKCVFKPIIDFDEL
jgi:uncharacterized protein with gpF-like domain